MCRASPRTAVATPTPGHRTRPGSRTRARAAAGLADRVVPHPQPRAHRHADRPSLKANHDPSTAGATATPSTVCAAMCHRLSRPAAALAALLLVAAALAACGGSASSNDIATRTAAEILAATKLAAEGARAVHVSGSIANGGRPVGLDVHLVAGRGARGRLSENGLSFELIQTGGSVYIKGSPAFYSRIGGAAAAQLLQGRWLKVPASSPEFASLSSLTDLRRLVDTALSTPGGVAKSGTATVNGKRA